MVKPMVKSCCCAGSGVSRPVHQAPVREIVVVPDQSPSLSASTGLTVVQNKDGATVPAPATDKNGKTLNVAMTGNSDTNRYLYLAIDPAFKQNLKSVWLTVMYFDDGQGSFTAQYDGNSDAASQ